MKLVFSEKTIECERKDEYLNAMKQTYKEWKENETDDNLCKALLEYFFIRFKTNRIKKISIVLTSILMKPGQLKKFLSQELSFFFFTQFIWL